MTQNIDNDDDNGNETFDIGLSGNVIHFVDEYGNPQVPTDANCIVTTFYYSPCAFAYRQIPANWQEDGTIIGGAGPCVTTNEEGELLPDLIISNYDLARSTTDSGLESPHLEASRALLRVATTMINIGEGPIEFKRTGEYFCCPDGQDCYPISPGDECEEDHTRERLEQIIYTKVGNSMLEQIGDETELYVEFHESHGHMHVDDYAELSLRKRDPSFTGFDANDPRTWETVGASSKISFCLSENANVIGQWPFAPQDMSTAQIVNRVVDAAGNAVDYWKDSFDPCDATLNLRNQLVNYPNYRLGKMNLTCLNGEDENGEGGWQGMAPGMGDIYGLDTRGNHILLPCDFDPGFDYFVLVEANPDQLYEESDLDNNIALTPFFPTDVLSTADEFDSAFQGNVPASDDDANSGDGIITWSYDNRVNEMVIVQTGNTLIIDHAEIEFMSSRAGIFVEKGAKLIVNHGKLMGNPCTGTDWRGIIVDGDRDLPQTGYDPTDIDSYLPDHGIVDLRHAHIHDAYTGVHLGMDVTAFDDVPQVGTHGGGLLFAEEVHFMDCSVGVLLRPYTPNSQSRITACMFEMTKPFLGTHRLPDYGYVNIWSRTTHGMEVMGSSFINMMGGEESGAGILSMNSSIRVGALDQGNTFIGLAHGVNCFARRELQGAMFIRHNIFRDVRRCVTFNGNQNSAVGHNFFSVVDEYASSLSTPAPALYALYALNSSGSLVNNNTVIATSEQETVDNYTWGLVFKDTNIEGIEVIGNSFIDPYFDVVGATTDYRFKAATQFEGDNQGVLVDCNDFQSINDFDIRIMNGQFEAIDECDPDFDELNPIRNTFHLCGAPDRLHISNLSADTWDLDYAPGYAPDPVCIFGDVIADECDESVDPVGMCEIIDYEGRPIEEIEEMVEETDDPVRQEQLRSRVLSRLVEDGDIEHAAQRLENRNTQRADEVLVSTLVSGGQLEAALDLLEQLPANTLDEIEFNALFSDIIAEMMALENPQTGKMGLEEIERIREMANDTDSNNTLLAQSHEAAMNRSVYLRTPASTAKQEVASAGMEVIDFTISPTLLTTDELLIEQRSAESRTYLIFDMRGQILHRVSLTEKSVSIDLSALMNGLYIIKEQSSGQARKFAVLR